MAKYNTGNRLWHLAVLLQAGFSVSCFSRNTIILSSWMSERWVMSYYFICYIVLCSVMLCYVMLCYVYVMFMLCHVMSCFIVWEKGIELVCGYFQSNQNLSTWCAHFEDEGFCKLYVCKITKLKKKNKRCS